MARRYEEHLVIFPIMRHHGVFLSISASPFPLFTPSSLTRPPLSHIRTQRRVKQLVPCRYESTVDTGKRWNFVQKNIRLNAGYAQTS